MAPAEVVTTASVTANTAPVEAAVAVQPPVTPSQSTEKQARLTAAHDAVAADIAAMQKSSALAKEAKSLSKLAKAEAHAEEIAAASAERAAS